MSRPQNHRSLFKKRELTLSPSLSSHTRDESGKKSLKYLGIQLASDGHIESEVSLKLGRAAQDFKVLMRLWNHCNISVAFKIIILSACHPKSTV